MALYRASLALLTSVDMQVWVNSANGSLARDQHSQGLWQNSEGGRQYAHAFTISLYLNRSPAGGMDCAGFEILDPGMAQMLPPI